MNNESQVSEITRFVLIAIGLFLLGTAPLPILCHFMPYHNVTIGIAAISILGAIVATTTITHNYNEHGHRIITGKEIDWKTQVFGWGSVLGLALSVIIFWIIL
ncbi:hypothetical protein HOD19_03810 [bacterium]|nr:hypothetical protein [bacterium]MBT4648939.1 hypothetical protein [bacterium]